MRFVVSVVLSICMAGLPVATAQALTADDAAIKKVLEDGAEAWNRGDMKSFVASNYERSPETVFLTADGPLMGWRAIENFYKQYWSKHAGRPGKLSYDNLQFKHLSPTYAIVYGKYRIVFDGHSKPEAGVFDLVFHKGSQDWRIMSDHSE